MPGQRRPQEPIPPGSVHCEFLRARMQPVHATASTPLRHTQHTRDLLEAAARFLCPTKNTSADSDTEDGMGEEPQYPMVKKMRAMEHRHQCALRALAQERKPADREQARAEHANTDVAQTVEQNEHLHRLAEQEERRVQVTEGLCNSLAGKGQSVCTQQCNLAATADRIGWHCNLDGTLVLGVPGENEIRMSPEHSIPQVGKQVEVWRLLLQGSRVWVGMGGPGLGVVPTNGSPRSVSLSVFGTQQRPTGPRLVATCLYMSHASNV